MMHYTVKYGNSADNILSITLKINNLLEQKTVFKLPAWRPGRYELGNFAQNMFVLYAFDEQNNVLYCKKTSKDQWEVTHPNTKSITLKYNYAAVIRNAGGTFKSPTQLVITPVNCLIFAKHLLNNKCQIELEIPHDFSTISSIKNKTCANYYELAASPIVCGIALQERSFVLQNTTFHVVFEGNVQPNWNKILLDFSKFTQEQVSIFGDFPSSDYYYLNLIFAEEHYHGVEHLHSTLIALGPDSDFEKDAFYTNLLGISCHELFHYWNICRIRPLELMPYNYTQESYFETGYIAEGVTTYYGDYLLGRSKTIDLNLCLVQLSDTITRHLSNPAKDKVSVTESSIDLWLDGYKAGVSGRKVSIYHKGASIALILDLWIRKTSNNNKSMDDLMLLMWQNHGENSIGYTSGDYKNYIEQLTNSDSQWYFDDYVFGTKDIVPLLQELLTYFGMDFKVLEDNKTWGISVLKNQTDAQKINFKKWMCL